MFSHIRPVLAVRTAALASVLCTLGLSGQETASEFFDTVDVQVVNVEVYVTDRDGQPVPGLTAEDFELYQDRKPVEIQNFYASSALMASQEAVASLDAPTSDRAQEAATELADVPAEQRLDLVVFVDNQNLSPNTRNRVIDTLRGSLFFNMRPEDRVTLVSYDGRLRVRQGLSTDPRDLAEELDRIAEGGASGVFSTLDRRAILRDLQQTDLEAEANLLSGGRSGGAPGGGSPGFDDAGPDWGGILQSIRTYAQAEYNRTVRTVLTLEHLIDSLAGLDGRKALVYISDGLSLRPGEALFQAFGRKAPAGFGSPEIESRDYDATQLFEQLGKTANASRVTFYTILAEGGSSHTMTLAERGAFFNSGTDAADLGQAWGEGLEALEKSNFRGSMQILAESTGGLATLSTRNFGQALRRVQQDLGAFYSLGYEPTGQDTDDHAIKVVVKKEGLEVRHRESFRQRSQEEQMAGRTHSALMFEKSSNPLGVIAEFGQPQKDKKGFYLVPVFVKFPLNRLVLAPGERTHDGQVSIYVGARSADDGNLSPVQRLPAPVTIPNDQLMTALGQVAGYRMMLQLREGEHAVAVSVRDEVAQIESTTVVSYDAGQATALGPDGAAAPAGDAE